MARVKGGMNAKRKHNKVLKLAKGYRGGGFNGRGGMGGAMGGGMRQNDIMKQAQKMQQDMLRMQEEMQT